MAKRPQHGQQDGGARGGDQLRASDRSICGEMVRYQLTGRRGGGGWPVSRVAVARLWREDGCRKGALGATTA